MRANDELSACFLRFIHEIASHCQSSDRPRMPSSRELEPQCGPLQSGDGGPRALTTGASPTSQPACMRESREGAEQERGRQPWAEMYYTRTLGRREFRWDEQDGDRSYRLQLRRTSRDASRAVSTCRGPAGACMSPCGCQDMVLKWAAVRLGHGAGASASHNCCAGREGTHGG